METFEIQIKLKPNEYGYALDIKDKWEIIPICVNKVFVEFEGSVMQVTYKTDKGIFKDADVFKTKNFQIAAKECNRRNEKNGVKRLSKGVA